MSLRKRLRDGLGARSLHVPLLLSLLLGPAGLPLRRFALARPVGPPAAAAAPPEPLPEPPPWAPSPDAPCPASPAAVPPLPSPVPPLLLPPPLCRLALARPVGPPAVAAAASFEPLPEPLPSAPPPDAPCPAGPLSDSLPLLLPLTMRFLL